MKQLENQKGEAQKRLDDLKAQVSKSGFRLKMHGFIFFFIYYFTQNLILKNQKILRKKCRLKNSTNLKQEDVDKSVLELYDELNEAKDKVCE